jgi:hypothetical protein
MSEKQTKPRPKIVKNSYEDPNRHDKSYKWNPNRTIENAFQIKSTAEMIAFLESDAGKDVEVEAKLLSFKEGEERIGYRKLGKKAFLETYKQNDKIKSTRRFREAVDAFASDANAGGGFSAGTSGGFGSVGNDFTPLLGGPFYKQLYYWNDWLRMHQDCFFAYHHDPFAKAAVNILTDFTLGNGFQVQCENNVAQALWDAFVEANDLQDKFGQFARELSAYGEDMWYWLPNNEKYVVYPRTKIELQDVPKVTLPRVQLLDPSNIVEIITHPEDITRVLFYVWLTPTQYQTYNAKDPTSGKMTSSIKLIYQQVPASEIMHFKVNAVSNEKRGRSDLFAGLPYGKRLRDSVNYAIIRDQKNAAWGIDTTVEGSQEDVDAYARDQEALGTLAPAGSEFIHTKAITRQYLGHSGGGGKLSESFEWSLNMFCAGVGIPVSYFGTHLSGGSTRASAIVATEPVAKRFEMRQQVYKSALKKISNRLFKTFNVDPGKVNYVFPEIITQDRSQKLKDIYLAETAKWISPERAAGLGTAELGVDDYDYDEEMKKIKEEEANEPLWANPLTQPPGILAKDPSQDAGGDGEAPRKPSAMTSNDRKDVKDNNGY